MQILKIYNKVQTIGILKNRKVRLDFTTKNHSILVKKTIYGQMKPTEFSVEKQLVIIICWWYWLHHKHGAGHVTTNGTGSLVFIDNVTADSKTRVNSKIQGYTLCSILERKFIGLNLLPNQSLDLNTVERAFQLSKLKAKNFGPLKMKKSHLLSCSSKCRKTGDKRHREKKKIPERNQTHL